VVRYTISGYAGAPGVRLRYVDGVTRTAISDGAGNYALTVPHGWSGSVTPALSGASFTPSRRSFTNVTANQVGQNFQALITKTFRSNATQDGWILEAGEDTDLGGTLNSIGTAIRVGDYATDGQYRSILAFDTSLIPDGAVITKVTLRIRRAGTAGTGSFGGDPALQLGDFEASGSLSPAGSIPNTPSSSWYSKVWTSGILSYINVTGLTELRLGFALDDNDDLGTDYLKFHSGNSGTTSYRPQLIIQYYVP
jgi:hypothetical protein